MADENQKLVYEMMRKLKKMVPPPPKNPKRVEQGKRLAEWNREQMEKPQSKSKRGKMKNY